MCGIAGVVSVDEQPTGPDASAALYLMGEQLAARGPDAESVYQDGFLGLIFRRLAIVDVEGGAQPFWSEDGRFVAAVNGEIYNHQDLRARLMGRHRFQTQSDCEVVVHLFEELGPGALGELQGMFSLVIWDRHRRALFLARDRLGIKPLYFSDRGRTLIFGSELKALLAHPGHAYDLDWEGLAYGVTDPDQVPTFVKDIRHLPGGCYLQWQGGMVTVSRYWSLADHFSDRDGPAAAGGDWEASISAAFQDVMEKHLIGEVEKGLFLSGGLDSALIAAAGAALDRQLRCFTIVNEATRANGDAVHAVALARELRLEIEPVEIDPLLALDACSSPLATFEYFIWMMDCPRFDLEWVLKHELHRFVKANRPGLKVVLVGQGADEIAGGYSNPHDAPVSDWTTYSDTGLRTVLEARAVDRAGIPRSLAGFLTAESLRSAAGTRPGWAPFHLLLLQQAASLQYHNLWHEDRTSSSQGIEARVPFLDHRLVELMASVPALRHPEFFWDKNILRRVSARCLPARYVHRPKVRFLLNRGGRQTHVEMLRAVLRRVFPAFRDAYLDTRASLFDPKRIGILAEQALAPDRAGEGAVFRLTSCMCVAVFDRICRELRNGWRPERPKVASAKVVAREALVAGAG